MSCNRSRSHSLASAPAAALGRFGMCWIKIHSQNTAAAKTVV